MRTVGVLDEAVAESPAAEADEAASASATTSSVSMWCAGIADVENEDELLETPGDASCSALQRFTEERLESRTHKCFGDYSLMKQQQ